MTEYTLSFFLRVLVKYFWKFSCAPDILVCSVFYGLHFLLVLACVYLRLCSNTWQCLAAHLHLEGGSKEPMGLLCVSSSLPGGFAVLYQQGALIMEVPTYFLVSCLVSQQLIPPSSALAV